MAAKGTLLSQQGAQAGGGCRAAQLPRILKGQLLRALCLRRTLRSQTAWTFFARLALPVRPAAEKLTQYV